LYANSCGDPICVGKTISDVRQNISDETKQKQAKNYSNAQRSKTTEQRKKQRKKAAETYFEHFETTPSNSPIQKKKSADTKFQRYGDAKYNNSTQTSNSWQEKTDAEIEIIVNKRRSTCVERFGVENAFMKPGSREKSAKSNSTGKEYLLPSGKIIAVRGYENLAIDILLGLYEETKFAVHDAYTSVNRHILRYYLDIFIEIENKIIEVKSRWWWDGNGGEKYKSRLENNLRKRKAVLAAGYAYEVWIFDKKNTLTVLSHDTDF